MLDGGEPIELGGARAKALLATLVLHPNQVVSVDRLAEVLWGECPPQTAPNAIQAYISHLRKILGRERIATRPPGYVLAVEPEAVDAVHFERLVVEARASLGGGDPARAAALLADGLGLWRGNALADFPSQAFAHADAARLQELRLAATENLMEARLALGEHTGVATELPTLVHAHPLRERLWGQLVVALYRCGRQAEAIGACATLRRSLAELGIDPSPELCRLEDAVRAQDPSLDWTPTMPSTAAEVPTNLPIARSSFVGRENELDELEKLLGSPGLLTVVGPGGVGKTRLGTAVARRLRASYPDGVWLVELAPVADPELVPQAVAVALGVREEPGRPLMNTLTGHLADRRALVILDNCEHLVGATARLLDILLSAAPHLGVLATSREPLLVAGETLWQAQPLAVPAHDDLGAEALVGFDAVRLFCERAQSAERSFALDAVNAPAVARLCRRLDGIPLAIELAAARAGTLSPAQIADRLDDRFRLLTTGTRTALARQRTLESAVDWSYDLLSMPERTLFRRLSAFQGFALEAAETVCADEALDAHLVAGQLCDLVDRSLVVAQPLEDGSMRYSLHETLRHYASRRLAEAGEDDAVRRRHLHGALALVERFRTEGEALGTVSRYEERRWFDRMQREHDNFRQALGWAVSAQPVEALELANELGHFWRVLGHLREGRRWVQAALAAATDAPLVLRARALANDGMMAQSQGDLAVAWPLLQEALELARAIGKEDNAGRILTARLLPGMGQAAFGIGDLEAARSLLEEALVVTKEIGHRWNEGAALIVLGRIAMSQRDFASASSLFNDALRTFQEIGIEGDVAECQTYLGKLSLLQRQHAAAEKLLEKAIEVHRTLGRKRMLALSLGILAELYVELGDLDQAKAIFHEELSVAQDIGLQDCEAEALHGLERLSNQVSNEWEVATPAGDR